MEKVSIVIPIYNAEKYMSLCLDSLFKQTYRKLEIIAVNDKSTDNSLDVLKTYQKDHKNLIIIDLEINRGVSNARNQGIKQATGEYIFFIDSDDFLDKDAIKILVNKALENKADVVDTERLFWYKRKEKVLTFTERKQLKKDLIIDNIYKNKKALTLPRYVTGKLYAKSVIEDVVFDDNLRCYEDGLFNQEIKPKFKKYMYAQGVYYHYLQRPNSLINTVSTNHLDYLFVAKRIKEVYTKINYFNLKIEKTINNLICSDIFVIISSKIPQMKISKAKKVSYLKKFLKLKTELNLSKISFKNKFLFFFFSKFGKIYFSIIKKINLVDLSFRFLNLKNKITITNKKQIKTIENIYLIMEEKAGK